MFKITIFPKLILLCSCVLAILFFYDLQNIDTFRQGTEGFYLQIAKEMYEQNSWMTPLYQGEPHWSKPPLVFWMANLLFAPFGGPSIALARLSIVLSSLFCVLIIAWWLKRHYFIDRSTTILLFLSTFGIIKYAKIFMMETPLSLFATVSTLFFIDYLQFKKRSFLIAASLFLAMSAMTKGPVSLAMVFGGLACFYLIDIIFNRKKSSYTPIIYFLCLTILLAIPWFVMSSIKHHDFFNYFFIRENFGKFSAKGYPIYSVFFGLLIYFMPWTLSSYIVFKNYKKLLSDEKSLIIFCTFLTTFVLWLIPTQRSHHYAMPTLSYLATLFIICLMTSNISLKSITNLQNIIKYLSLFIYFLLFIVITIFSNDIDASGITRAIIFTITALILISKKVFSYLIIPNKEQLVIVGAFFIAPIWLVILPKMALPLLPQVAIKEIGQEKIYALVAKPYFLAEALKRGSDGIIKAESYELEDLLRKENLPIVLPDFLFYTNKKLQTNFTVRVSWPVWKNKVKLKDIKTALKNQSLSSLQTKYLLIDSNTINSIK